MWKLFYCCSTVNPSIRKGFVQIQTKNKDVMRINIVLQRNNRNATTAINRPFHKPNFYFLLFAKKSI